MLFNRAKLAIKEHEVIKENKDQKYYFFVFFFIFIAFLINRDLKDTQGRGGPLEIR